MEKSIKKNAVYNIIKNICSLIFPLITFPYITHVLLPNNVGKVNFAQSFVNYFVLVAALGINTYATRECSLVKKDKNKLSALASQFFTINMVTTIISYILLIITLLMFKSLNNYKHLIIIESSIIIFTTLGTDWLNSAMEDFRYITIRYVIFQFIALISMFIFVKNTDDYYKYIIISVVTTIGPNILNIFYRKRFCKIKITKNVEWTKHFVPVILLFVMMLSQTIFNNVDITMLGLMQNDYAVGLYSMANKVIRIIAQVVQSLGIVVIPRLSLYFSNNEFDNANKLLRKILSFNIMIGLPCVIGVIMLAPEIVTIVGGIEYLGATTILRILILSFLFSLVGGSFLGNAILIPMKKENYYMKVCLITAFLNVILNAILIPKYSANGAALATSLNGVIIFLLLMINIDKRIKIENIKEVFIAPFIGSLFIIIICLIIKPISNIYIRTILSVFCSCISYFMILILLKYKLVIENIKNLKNRFVKRSNI